jgi:hypothetical protein
MELSDSLPPCIMAVPLRFAMRAWWRWSRPGAGPPGSRTPCFRACQGSPTPPGPWPPRPCGVHGVAFRVLGARRHPDWAISGLNTLPARSPVNAACLPLPIATHDSGPAWLARPSLSETCTPSHRAGLSRRTLTLAVSRRALHSTRMPQSSHWRGRLQCLARPGSLSWKGTGKRVDEQGLPAPNCVYWALGFTVRSTCFAGRGGKDTVCHPC